VQNTAFSTNKTLNINGRLLDLSKPRVMGILNITPDSFYDGGQFSSEKEILAQTEKMLTHGATFIDVGGYSTRPGAPEISEAEEIARVVNAIKILIKNFNGINITVDTFRSEVAKAAVAEGASMINDVSGGALDPKMFEQVAALNVPYILMHMRGNPQTMMQQTTYNNLLTDVTDYFHHKLYELNQLGVKDLVIDPGFGFAKNIDQNFRLLNHLEYFKILDRPMLVGISRKSMIWKTLNISADEALNGTTALNTLAILKGASILRVHDVKEAMEVIKLCDYVNPSFD
jgi:dihydropteroate synthase